MSTVGVVGAGTIGTGVAQTFAESGHRVVLVDVCDDALASSVEAIARNTRLMSLVDGQRRGRTPAADAVFPTTDLAQLARAEYVVENVTENWNIKSALYTELDRVCPPECVLAVNTSAVPITKLAGCTTRADRVVGNHFMNPVPLMPLVEVIRGYHTSDETVAHSRAVIAGLGKDSVVVRDSPGFVTNRVLMLTVNEAIYTLHEGVADPAGVDRLFRQCFGHRMGPLETADLIGLDTVLYSLETLLANFRDPKYRPCPLLCQYVDAGLLGRKSGRGFHVYEPAEARPLRTGPPRREEPR